MIDLLAIVSIYLNNDFVGSERKVEFINPIPSGLFEGGTALGGGGGGRKVPAAYNSETINDNEMKLGGVVKDH